MTHHRLHLTVSTQVVIKLMQISFFPTTDYKLTPRYKHIMDGLGKKVYLGEPKTLPTVSQDT